MSKVKIEGNASGTGTLTISAPATDTDRALTLPDEAGEFVTADSNGNVGIGTDSISAISNQKVLEVEAVRYATLRASTTEGDNVIAYLQGNDNSAAGQVGTETNHPLMFVTNDTERMRIDSSGNLLVGKTSESDFSLSAVSVSPGASAANIKSSRASGGTDPHVYFYNNNGLVGSITTGGSATAYNTSSDYRLKENVVDMHNAIDRVKALQPKRFNFIADEDDTTVDGFLAHEVSDVIPEAISGEKDAMRTEEYEVTPAVKDEEGNVVTEAVMGTRTVPDYQGIDQSKLVPLLTGALQEAIAKIEALETRIETLENA